MFRRLGLLLFVSLALAACTAEPDYSSIAPQDQIAFSGQFLEQIRTGAVDAALDQISDEGRESARPMIENAAKSFPKQAVRVVRVVGYRPLPPAAGATGAQPVANLELRYDFANNDALMATIILSNDGQRYYVSFLNFTALPASLIADNDFPGPGKSVAHYVYIGIAVGIVLFILATLYVCIRGPGPRWRWRWLWLIAIIFTVMRFNLVWTTGQLAPSFGLVPFGFWFVRNGAYAPYLFTMGFPLGAILFWAMRSRWTAPKVVTVATPAPVVVEVKKDESPSV